MIRLLDAIADWLRETLGTRAQLRLGVAITLASFTLYAYFPLAGEPPIIYLMSAFAITLSGLTLVVAAEVLDDDEGKDS